MASILSNKVRRTNLDIIISTEWKRKWFLIPTRCLKITFVKLLSLFMINIFNVSWRFKPLAPRPSNKVRRTKQDIINSTEWKRKWFLTPTRCLKTAFVNLLTPDIVLQRGMMTKFVAKDHTFSIYYFCYLEKFVYIP